MPRSCLSGGRVCKLPVLTVWSALALWLFGWGHHLQSEHVGEEERKRTVLASSRKRADILYPLKLKSIVLVFTKLVCVISIFKASALWADAFYMAKCQYVCLFVCLSVCLSVCSLLRYRLTVFLPPLPKVGCPIFWEIWNPWGKVVERNGLRFEIFCL